MVRAVKGDPAWQAESELHVFHSKQLDSRAQNVMQPGIPAALSVAMKLSELFKSVFGS